MFIDSGALIFSVTLGTNNVFVPIYRWEKNQDEEKVGNLFKVRMLQCLGSFKSELLKIYVVTRLINVLFLSSAGGLIFSRGEVVDYHQYEND